MLLADGKTVSISSLKVGDKVEASDARTGRDQAETCHAPTRHRPLQPHRQDQSRHRGHPHHLQAPVLEPLWTSRLIRTNYRKNDRLKAPNGATVTVVGAPGTPEVDETWFHHTVVVRGG